MAASVCRTWCRIARIKHTHLVTQNVLRCYATANVKENESVLKRVKKFVFGETVAAEQLDQSDSVYYELKEAKTPQVYNMEPNEVKDKLDSIVKESIPRGRSNWLTANITDDIVKFKVLQRCYKEFGVVPSSHQLNHITQVQDILDYYCSFQNPSGFKTFSILDAEDIPPNLQIGGKVPRKQL